MLYTEAAKGRARNSSSEKQQQQSCALSAQQASLSAELTIHIANVRLQFESATPKLGRTTSFPDSLSGFPLNLRKITNILNFRNEREWV